MYNVKITPAAEKDITNIYTFMKYRLHLPELAEQFRVDVKNVISTLKENPNRGSKHYHGSRKIMYKKYRIIYKVYDDTVFIIGME